jgi:ABC-type antimicrobial peptide transport system permease subunit
MTAWNFILASLRHYRRIHLAVALGVAVATAVLTGALLVGDSVRGSLRDLTLQRLGRIDSAVVAVHPLRAELASEVAGDAEFKTYFASAQPAFLLNGTLQAGSGADARRATAVSVVGYGPEFWSLGKGGPASPISDDEAAIAESLAKELNIRAGDSILLQIPIAGAIPADSPLGAKQLEKTSRSRRFKVAAVLPAVGLARFGLMPSQQLPRNMFVSLASMQKLVEQPGKANAILVAGNRGAAGASEESQKALRESLRPRLEDYGVTLESLKSPTDCLQISADQLVLPNDVIAAADKVFGEGSTQPVVTYLANTIVVGQRKIPYSTITGVDSTAQLGPLRDDAGKPIELAENEIVLNRWAADDLKAKVGDDVMVTFYEPESTHGRLSERRPPPVFTLKAIAELKGKDGRPTAAADPRLTPEMPGVTDQKSISDWDLPFELVEKVRPEDEKYWDEYRTTPKAFVSLATAKKLWASRWGTISLLRLPPGNAVDAAKRLEAAIDPSAMGVAVLPVKRLGLSASAGTTPFGVLFLAFSMFLIASAVMLVALLFQLGIQQRTKELGTLEAVGIGRRRLSRLLGREGVIVAAVGATVGVAAGVLYAWLVVLALTTWWVAAISTPFLRLHLGWLSLVIGWVVGVIVSWVAIWWSIRKFVRLPAARLLAGATDDVALRADTQASTGWRKWLKWSVIRAVLVVLAVATCVAGFYMHGEEQAGSFFTGGAAVLALLLGEIRYRLRQGTLTPALSRREREESTFSLMRLSMLNTARNPGRSTLTIGLVAAASFLIVAVSAFHLDTGEGGTGGFEFLATSDQPIHYDLNTTEGRQELGFSDTANRQMNDYRVYSLRVAAGEDASCLNLYQPKQPRVLGVPQMLIERGGFAWAATEKGYSDKPWAALDVDLGRDEKGAAIVPAVLDMSTAVYSLHLSGVGSRLPIQDAAGQTVTVQVVGLLENSVLQGNLLVSEQNFLKLFPDTGGYRFFLIERAKADRGDVAASGNAPSGVAALESALAEEGFDVTDAREQLSQFLSVQNTYLSTFQSLGALGLLLGTVGLAVVQLRSVLERRGELALMRAGGFGSRRLVWMVIGENALLLLGGLVVGCLAAVVALIPQWAPHGASVPWQVLGVLLGTIAVVGIVAGWLATRRQLAAPILPALRGD